VFSHSRTADSTSTNEKLSHRPVDNNSRALGKSLLQFVPVVVSKWTATEGPEPAPVCGIVPLVPSYRVGCKCTVYQVPTLEKAFESRHHLSALDVFWLEHGSPFTKTQSFTVA